MSLPLSPTLALTRGEGTRNEAHNSPHTSFHTRPLRCHNTPRCNIITVHFTILLLCCFRLLLHLPARLLLAWELGVGTNTTEINYSSEPQLCLSASCFCMFPLKCCQRAVVGFPHNSRDGLAPCLQSSAQPLAHGGGPRTCIYISMFIDYFGKNTQSYFTSK